MKSKITKKICVELTLDSSEAIMFSKGGRHKIDLCTHDFDSDHLNDHEVEISIQIEKDQQGRYNFITGEAEKHKSSFSENTSFNEVKKL